MSEIKKSDIVRCWPGTRTIGAHQYAAQVISDGTVKFGDTDCVRVRGIDGGSDYIALTHVELIGDARDRVCHVQTGADALYVCEFDFEDIVIDDRDESLKFAKLIKGFR